MRRKSGVILPKGMSRRSFLQLSSVSSLVVSSGAPAFAAANLRLASRVAQKASDARATNMQIAIRDLVNTVTCRREEVENFLDPEKPNWAKFDPELGYTWRDYIMKDGVDGSRTITSFQ